MRQATTMRYTILAPFDFDGTVAGLLDSATGSLAARLVESPLDADASTNIYGGPANNFSEHYAKLQEIVAKPSLWPIDVEPPKAVAVDLARLILRQLEEDRLVPTRVVASAEGGIAICFVKDNKYADLECLNNGEILGVTSNRRDRPTAWEVAPIASEIARASDRIRLFFHSSSAKQNAPKWAWRR